MHSHKIFNHDIMTCTHETVTGNYLYGGRVLGSSEVEDVIQLHPHLRSEWAAICKHYAQVGLTHSQNVIWAVSLNVLMEYPEYEASVFYFGDAVNQDSPVREWFRRLDRRWAEVVEQVNNKNRFIQLAEDLGVPVPKTVCFQHKFAIHPLDQLPYPCYVKPAVSVNGVGIYRCQDAAELQQALRQIEDGVPLQIQQEVVAAQFLNLQYQVVDQRAERLAVTEQILEGCAHIGNRYPTVHQPWELFDPMADWMAAQGMKGIFAFDVAVVTGAGQPRYFAIECNPRFNGASYPTGIAHKLNLAAWENVTFKTHCRSLKELDLSGLEYDPISRTGVILVNWGSILVGKLGVLIAGDPEQQRFLRERLKQRLAEPLPQNHSAVQAEMQRV